MTTETENVIAKTTRNLKLIESAKTMTVEQVYRAHDSFEAQEEWTAMWICRYELGSRGLSYVANA